MYTIFDWISINSCWNNGNICECVYMLMLASAQNAVSVAFHLLDYYVLSANAPALPDNA